MSTFGPRYSSADEREARRQLEGEERIGLLHAAEFIAVTVGGEPGDPVAVFISWKRDLIEQAYPGTAIWQAAVRRFLRAPSTTDYAEPIVRAAAAESLEQFPSLERWLDWHDHQRHARAERRRRGDRDRPIFWIGSLW